MSSSTVNKNNTQTAAVPHSQEMEEALLGAVICDPASYFTVAAKIKAEYFFTLRHRWIWQAISELMKRDRTFDSLTLYKQLECIDEVKKIGGINAVGGGAYLTQLTNNTPTARYVSVYADMVARLYARRKMMMAADVMKTAALDEALDSETIVEIAISEILEAQGLLTANRTIAIKELPAVDAKIEHLQSEYARTGQISLQVGVPTGLADVDATTGGLLKGTVTYIAGTTGTGKTSFCLSVILNVAKLGVPVWYVPLENDINHYLQRLVAIEAAIPHLRIISGAMSADEYSRYLAARKRVLDLPIYFYKYSPDQAFTPRTLFLHGQSMIREHGIKLIVVDHFLRMKSGNDKHNEYQMFDYISKQLQPITKKLGVPLLLATQLNGREMRKHATKSPPSAYDLKYAGQDDADTILILHRDDTDPNAPTKLIVDKNRDGSKRGVLELIYSHGGYKNANSKPVTISPLEREPVVLLNAVKTYPPSMAKTAAEIVF